MKLSDEAKKQMETAAHRIKEAAGAPALWPKAETTQEMQTGSPRTPGYDEHQGKTMKPKEPRDRQSAPQWPQAREEASAESRDREPEDMELDLDR